MIQLISLSDNFLKTHRIQSLTFLKNKIKSSKTFQKSYNISQKYMFKKNVSKNPLEMQTDSKYKTVIKNLAFWSSLFFITGLVPEPNPSQQRVRERESLCVCVGGGKNYFVLRRPPEQRHAPRTTRAV